ncbi:unnamed protein product [Owenia fusiformis]|uniref:Uncharacterized protein n=1 Tax=Owenia fusiformis TaxID=6347 RepID=A0A8J1V1P0_OWEFU|nr:unnamed protein product [Owenia fusiformis]
MLLASPNAWCLNCMFLILGSPFEFEVLDPGRVVFVGDGLLRVPIHKPAFVTIDPQGTHAAAQACIVEVVAPSDNTYRADVSPTPQNNKIRAEFTPTEVGPHLISVCYGDIEIPGSPFACEVYDISKVKVGKLTQGMVGRPHEFDIDTREAGVGDIAVCVKAIDFRVAHKLHNKGNGLYRCHFVPSTPMKHTIHITFSKQSIPGSPYKVDVLDNTPCTANGPGLQKCAINKPSYFNIEPKESDFESDVEVTITSPNKQNVPYHIKGTKRGPWRVEYTPGEVGVYTINIKYDNIPIAGSAFKCNVYDISKVRIIRDVMSEGQDKDGIPGEDIVFFVDASDAGTGNLEVIVTCAKDGQRIPNYLEAESGNRSSFRVYFTPKPNIYAYNVNVFFNEDEIEGA